MNKKSIDKIDTFTLNFSYNELLKDIFNLNSLGKFMNYIINDINANDSNISLINKLLELCWYVYMDEILIDKNNFIKFYNEVLETKLKKNSIITTLEVIINENIKKYLIEKNNINYHKIILESI